MKNHKSLLFLLCCVGFYQTAAYSQATTDSLQLDTSKMISFALDGNIPKVLELINEKPDSLLIGRHARIKKGLNDRFLNEDKSDYLAKRHSEIDSLLIIYRNYWRKNFYNYPKVHDTMLMQDLSVFLRRHFKPAKNLNALDGSEKFDTYLSGYIKSKGYYSTGFGKVGRFQDLLVWRKQTDTTYTFMLNDQKIKTPVVFMDDFITIGWEEYATLDIAYPGGWAKPKALYCVRKAYDLQSESFLISYLAHEGRHFEDNKLFPKLLNADLEYRAKLIELSMLDKNLFDVLAFFVANADPKTEDGHKKADYYVVAHLSEKIFSKEFETDMAQWKAIKPDVIRNASKDLLKQNTMALKKEGKQAVTYFKESKI